MHIEVVFLLYKLMILINLQKFVFICKILLTFFSLNFQKQYYIHNFASKVKINIGSPMNEFKTKFLNLSTQANYKGFLIFFYHTNFNGEFS